MPSLLAILPAILHKSIKTFEMIHIFTEDTADVILQPSGSVPIGLHEVYKGNHSVDRQQHLSAPPSRRHENRNLLTIGK